MSQSQAQKYAPHGAQASQPRMATEELENFRAKNQKRAEVQTLSGAGEQTAQQIVVKICQKDWDI